MRRWLWPVLLIGGTVLASNSASASGGESNFRVSGFSTLGYGVLLTKDEQMKEYMGIGRRGSMLRDTKVGLNLFFRINSELSFSGQIVGRGVDFFGQEYADNVATFDWYFLRYRPWDGVELRAGRQPLPFSLLAETQDVGFVNPWVRPPVEVYAMAPLKSVTGVQGRYAVDVGGWLVSTGIYGGQDHLRYGFNREGNDPTTGAPTVTHLDSAESTIDTMVGGIVATEYQEFKAQVAVIHFRQLTEAEYPVTINTGLPFPPTARATSSFASEQTFDSYSLGTRWENEWLLAVAELRQVDYEYVHDSRSNGYFAGHYGTVGVHLGRLTPVLTLADYRQHKEAVTTAFNPATGGMGSSIEKSDGHSTSTALGLVTQLGPSVVWKVEYLRARNLSDDHFGPFAMTLYPGKTATVVSTSLDTVF